MEEIFGYYKTHPRILEIRFILLFSMFSREMGHAQATKWYETICSQFNCDFNKILDIINKRFDIKRFKKTKKTRWQQSVIFAAACFGETPYKVAKDYLIMTPSALYNADYLKVENFATDEWLRDLDEEATLCGLQTYRIEVERFFEAIDGLNSILERWHR